MTRLPNSGTLPHVLLDCRVSGTLRAHWPAAVGCGPSAVSGNVCPGDDAAESFVVGVVVAPDDVAADHAALLLVGGVVGAVEGEVPQRGELRLDAV